MKNEVLMKRAMALLMVFLLAVNLTGCEAVKKKFTRKKKGAVKMPRFYQLKKYTKKPSSELYRQHYAYWESWQSELVSVIGQNHKKDLRCIEEATGQLKDMQSILIPEKAEQMQPHVDNMENARSIIRKGPLTFANKDSVKKMVEREDRAIRSEFCYAKVKDSLKKSMDEEPAPKLGVVGKEVPVEK